MGRMVIGFLLGTVLGFATLYLAFHGAVRVLEGSDLEAASRRNMSLDAYQEWVDVRYERPFTLAAMAAALMFGVLGARAFNRPIFGLVGGRPDRGDPLTREEFRQVLHTCGWVPLDEHGPEYVRGLAVGRLADSHPALARKVDEFGDAQMAALHHHLCRRRMRGV
jgi:hypothetical protein